MSRHLNSYPGLKQAWVIFAVFLAVSTAGGLILGKIIDLAGIQSMSVGNFIAYNASLLFVIWFAWRYRRSDDDNRLYFKPVSVILYPLLILFTISFAVFLDPLTNLIPMPEKIEKIFALLAKKDVWTFLMVGITGPILEETLFRGIILDGFLKRYKPGKAIFWSAFLFGLFHLNPWQFIPGFTIGLILGYIYYKTRSLIPVILLHIVNNSFSYFIMYIYGEDVTSFADLFQDKGDYFLFLGISTAIAAGTLLLLFKILNKNPIQWTFNSETNYLSSPEQAADSEKQ